MTQRSDWDNLLTALESDPHLREALRRHILTEELLNLPVTVASLAKHVETIALAVGQLQTDMTSVKQEMVEMRADITSVKGEMVEVRADIASVKGEIVEVRADIASVKGEMVEVRADIASVKGEMVEMRADIASGKGEMVEMRADIASVKEDVGQLQRGQNIQTGVLSEAAGAAYENTAIRLAPRLLRRHLGLTETVLFSHYPEGRHGNLKAMAEAVPRDQAAASEALEDLMETDMVFKAKGLAGEDVYIVAEASLTVQASDVVRARRRAETLNMIVGLSEVSTEAVAVVMGKSISEDAQALLIEQGDESGMVTFLMANADAPDAQV